MGNNNLGKASIYPQGQWNGTTTYNLLSLVQSNGSGYLGLQNGIPIGTEPGVTSNWQNYWMLLSSKGNTGNGISSIVLTSSSGLIDTYTITFDNSDTSTFFVTNGAAGTLTIGTTTTLPAGSNATVSNTGTANAAIFNFGIPQGSRWYTGTAITGTSTTPASFATGISNAGTGDLYLNNGNTSDAGNVYQCTTGGNQTTAKWAYNSNVLGIPQNAVQYTAQSLTESQKQQARNNIGALGTGNNVFSARWDKINAQMVRMNDAASITTNTTNFYYRGSASDTINNPFDNIYPWNGITLCNIDVPTYMGLTTGASLRECVTAWLGDPDFSYTNQYGVWQYVPQFWYKVWDDSTYRYYDVSPSFIAGYKHSPEMVNGRWWGGVYSLTISGNATTCFLPCVGMPGKSIAMSTLHTYAKNYSATLENIYSYSAMSALMLVEYATMNMQNAIGNGVSSLYRQSSDLIQTAVTSSTTVSILTANAGAVIPGAIFDIGTSDGGAQVGSFIVSSISANADNTSTITLTTDGTTPASVTVTTANYWSVHGLSNMADSSIGSASGYIGTNGASNAYYRGSAAFSNLFRYVLGAYRQTGTGAIWVANSESEADQYDALNTSVHTNTGNILTNTSGYIQTLGEYNDIGFDIFCTSAGGNSSNPVGDYCHVPALTTVNTILRVGGLANDGSGDGRCYGAWNYAAGNAAWNVSAFPHLKNP